MPSCSNRLMTDSRIPLYIYIYIRVFATCTIRWLLTSAGLLLGQTMNSLSLLRLRPYRHPDARGTLIASHGRSSLPPRRQAGQGIAAAIPTAIVMRDRAKNRKPTQRGRYLSTEAIQAVQALKRTLGTVGGGGGDSLERVLAAKVQRLIKGDMVAVLRELQSQGEGLLALQVPLEISFFSSKVLVFSIHLF